MPGSFGELKIIMHLLLSSRLNIKISYKDIPFPIRIFDINSLIPEGRCQMMFLSISLPPLKKKKRLIISKGCRWRLPIRLSPFHNAFALPPPCNAHTDKHMHNHTQMSHLPFKAQFSCHFIVFPGTISCSVLWDPTTFLFMSLQQHLPLW